MKKVKSYCQKHYPLILIILSALVISLPLMRLNALSGHDATFHFFRAYGTKLAILDHQLIPMVNYSMLNGLGFAPNIFYGILSSYGVTLISFFTPTFGLSVNLFIILTILLSGIFMYYFLLDVTNNKNIALGSAFIYMVAPYHLYDIYYRMALGEIVSFIFIPILFHGLYNIVHNKLDKWWYITIATALLFLSHTISTLMVGIFAFLYLLGNIKKVWQKEKIIKLISSVLLAVVLALPSFIPLLEAKSAANYMVFDSTYMKTNPQYMHQTSINLFSKITEIPHLIVVIYSVIILLAIIYLIYRKCFKKERLTNFTYFILALISLILTLNIFPWQWLPEVFSTFQFPWRFLLMTSFFLAIIIPIYINQLFKNPKILFIPVIIFSILSISYLNAGFNKKIIDNNIVNKNAITLKNKQVVKSTGSASSEYLTDKSIYNYAYLKDYVKPTIIKGTGNIKSYEKNGSHLISQVIINEPSNLELPYIFYPGYKITINDKEIKYYETNNGLIGINLNKGEYEIKAYYKGTKGMILAYSISLISWLSLITFLLVKKRKKS